MSPAAQPEPVEGEVSLDEWISSIGGEANHLFKIYRVEPLKHAGKDCKGHLGDVTDPPSEQSIRDEWGGGKIQIKVFDGQTKKQKTSKTIYIVGDPKFADAPTNGHRVPDSISEDPSLVSKAMTMQQEAAELARQRADEAEERARVAEAKANQASKLDTETLDRFMQPLRDQIDRLDKDLHAERELRAKVEADHKAELERTRMESQNRHGQDAGTLANMVASEQNRMGTLREQHASELRALRENHNSELRTVRESYEARLTREADQRKDDATRFERALERALDNEKRNAQVAIDAQKTSYEGRIDSLKQREADLNRSLTEAKVEMAELRSRKEKTLIDQANELASVRETLNEISGGGDKEETSTFDKVMTMAGPILQGIGSRIENQPRQQPQQRQRPPQPQQRQRRAPPGAPAAQQAQQPPRHQGPPIKLKRDEVNLAVSLMEGAIGNKTKPEVFAETARVMVPVNIVQALRVFGPDRFLTEVAQVPANSLLLTVEGRRFVRKVLAVLLGPTVDDLPPINTAVEAAPVPADPLADMPLDDAAPEAGGLDPAVEAAAAAAAEGEVFT